ncbi:MAG: hypothetical protein ACLFTH_04775 [Candidatus Woesearchaeota archaeon]
MLTKNERKGTVEYIIDKVIEKGTLVNNTGTIKKYEAHLLYCSLGILKPANKKYSAVVEIAESFGKPDFKPESWQDESFDGVRTLYRGGTNGLNRVVLQGLYYPEADGRVLPPSERLQRSVNHDDERKLAPEDIDRFDAFLSYARREL